MTVALMPPIECAGIAGQQTTHEWGHSAGAATQQNVSMVGHECPGIDGNLCVECQTSHPLYEVLTIDVVFNNRPLFDSSNDDMVKSVGANPNWPISNNSVFDSEKKE